MGTGFSEEQALDVCDVGMRHVAEMESRRDILWVREVILVRGLGRKSKVVPLKRIISLLYPFNVTEIPRQLPSTFLFLWSQQIWQENVVLLCLRARTLLVRHHPCPVLLFLAFRGRFSACAPNSVTFTGFGESGPKLRCEIDDRCRSIAPAVTSTTTATPSPLFSHTPWIGRLLDGPKRDLWSTRATTVFACQVCAVGSD